MQGQRTLSLLVENCGRAHQGNDLDNQHKGDEKMKDDMQLFSVSGIKFVNLLISSSFYFFFPFHSCFCRPRG